MRSHLLNVRSINCRFEIFVNDVLVLHHHGGDSVSVELPVNHWIRGEENAMVARVLPPPGEKAVEPNSRVALGMSVLVEDDSDRPDSRERIASVESDLFRIPGIESPPLIEAVGGFISLADDPLPWESAPEWRLERGDLELVRSTFERLHGLLERRDVEGFMRMSTMKCETCAPRFGTSALHFTQYLRDSIEELVGSPNLALVPLRDQTVVPRYFGHGRLASGFNPSGNPPLAFLDEDGGEITFLDVFLMKDAAGRAVVVR